MNSKEILETISKSISGEKKDKDKIVNFILNCLGVTPIIGGVFSGAASVFSDKDQRLVNKAFLDYLNINENRLEKLERSLERLEKSFEKIEKSLDSKIGYITFSPNTVEIFSASNVSSITDKGILDFSINHLKPLDGYVFQYYGDGEVVIESAKVKANNLDIKFKSPCPNTVTVIFFKI